MSLRRRPYRTGDTLLGRVSARVGPKQDGRDRRISRIGPDGDIDRLATSSQVAYKPTHGLFLVVWGGDEVDGV
jgi:hypothetical protein